MKTHVSTAGLVLLLATQVPTASAQVKFQAKHFHDINCTRCHDTTVYTRENRRVKSYAKLESQVARCDANLATKLFPEDLALLVEHLNTNYYKFER